MNCRALRLRSSFCRIADGRVLRFKAFGLIVGLLIVTGILLLIRPQRRPMAWRRLPSAFIALIKYVVILAYDLIISGIQVARIVLDPALPVEAFARDHELRALDARRVVPGCRRAVRGSSSRSRASGFRNCSSSSGVFTSFAS